MKVEDLRVGDLVSIAQTGFGGVTAYFIGEFFDGNASEPQGKAYVFLRPGLFQIRLTKRCIQEKGLQLILVKRSEKDIASGVSDFAEAETETLIRKVEDLMSKLPDGMVIDADTRLADYLEEVDNYVTGFASDIFSVWRNAKDKKAVEDLFYEFTDVTFQDFLVDAAKCMEEEIQDVSDDGVAQAVH